jgi:hypothetical protein
LTEDDVRVHAAEVLNLAPTAVLEVYIPPFEARLRARSAPMTSGDVWLSRVYDDDFQSDSFVERQILVPFDESEPMLEFELPRNFGFRSAVDDLILGVYVDPETEVESVRVYRWHVR